MFRHLIFCASLLSLSSALPAVAQPVDEDLRCMILSGFFKNVAKDAAQKQAAADASLYYLGRVAARVPANQVKQKYLALVPELNGKNAGALMNACVQQLQAEQRSMITVGQEIARSLPKPAAPTKK